jgi:hypothetical protein
LVGTPLTTGCARSVNWTGARAAAAPRLLKVTRQWARSALAGPKQVLVSTMSGWPGWPGGAGGGAPCASCRPQFDQMSTSPMWPLKPASVNWPSKSTK